MSLVQTASASLDGSSTVTLTFPNNIGAGNSVVVALGGQYVDAADGTTVTPASGADIYTQAVSDTNTVSSIWYVLSSGGGYDSITATNSSGLVGAIFAYEVSKLTAKDKSHSGVTNYATSFSSGSSGTPTQANEFVVGTATDGDDGADPSITGPSSGWTNQYESNPGDERYSVCGYLFLTSATAKTYSGICTNQAGNNFTGACIATFEYTPAGTTVTGVTATASVSAPAGRAGPTVNAPPAPVAAASPAGIVIGSVQATVTTAWNTLATVKPQQVIEWNTRKPVTATKATAWNSRELVTATKATAWNSRAMVKPTVACAWVTYARVKPTVAIAWHTNFSTAATDAIAWNVRVPVTATQATSWNDYNPVTATQATAWIVLKQIRPTRAL